MRRNAVAFALGVISLQSLPEIPRWEILGVLACLFAVLGALRDNRVIRCLIPLSCLLVGFCWAAWRAEQRLTDQLPAMWEGRDVVVVGTIAGLPQAFSHGQRFEFDVDNVLTPGATLPSRIMISYYQGMHDGEVHEGRPVLPGERWHFTIRLKRPHGNANPYGFDYEAWLFERGLRATGYVRPKTEAVLLVPMIWKPEYGIERMRYRIRARFQELLPADAYPFAGILVALAVGDQRAIQGDLWNIFNRTGVTHLISVSGLHITLVSALFAFAVGSLWRHFPSLVLRFPAQRAAILAGCIAAFAYTWLAGFGVPAQRTLYMLVVAALAMLTGRVLPASRILSAALVVVLIIDPWSVLSAGFWLSFGAVGALLLVGAAWLGPTRGWQPRLWSWSKTQWAATLASLPILVVVFQQFSLVSPVANAVAIPVVSFIVTPLALLGALIPWWPILALAHWVLSNLMVFLQWCSNWPMWIMPAPPLWAAVAAGLGVAVVLLPRGARGRLAGVALLLPAVWWPVDRPAAGSARITVLDVGQGLAALVQTRNHSLLYDPGPLYSAESDAGQRVVAPYLRAIGLDRLDMMMVTHRDSDHSGGAGSVLAALPVEQIRTSVAGMPGDRCLAGQEWDWDGVRFAILHPTESDYAAGGKSNHLSCVLRVEAGQTAMLLTSDIEVRDEIALLARDRTALRADVLLVPHHGSRTSSSPSFVSAVGSRAAIIPVGYRNRFGHPKEDILARYESRSIPFWRTDRDGAVTVELAKDEWHISSWREEHKRYWHGQ